MYFSEIKFENLGCIEPLKIAFALTIIRFMIITQVSSTKVKVHNLKRLRT